MRREKGKKNKRRSNSLVLFLFCRQRFILILNDCFYNDGSITVANTLIKYSVKTGSILLFLIRK